MDDLHLCQAARPMEECAVNTGLIQYQCKPYFFNQDHPARGLEDKSRWMHVCRTAGKVFAVLRPYPCPICGEGTYEDLANKVEETIVRLENRSK